RKKTKSGENTEQASKPISQLFINVLDENGSTHQLKASYYLILGEYFLQSSAIRSRNELAENAINAHLYFIESKGSNFLFTYLFYSTSSEAETKMSEIKDQTGHEQVQVLYVSE
ncbi:MAG: hypothetical protein AAF616_08035, partial [Bacteroidota bacterium]